MRTLLMRLALALMLMPAMAAQAQDADTQDADAKYATGLLKPGTQAPDFALQTPDGKTVRLSDFRGRYVVLDFWASWCPDCIRDVPNVKRLYETYAERGFEFIGVSFDDQKARWTAALEKHGIKYTQVSELKKWKTTEISKAYCISWIPTLYLIDREGKVVLGTVMSEKLAGELSKISPECE